MKRATVRLALSALIVLLGARVGWPCSTFCFETAGRPFVGKNYDWGFEDALVIVNKRNVSKTAFAVSDQPMSWTSRYGSVTFNQYGREFPLGGINEVGLVVEVMWLSGTQYPAADDRASISTLQWVQYQLDCWATVEEVIASDEYLRISPLEPVKLHYLVADKSGQCAVIEFIDGKMVHHTGPLLVARVLTNSPYAESVAHLKTHVGFGGKSPVKCTEGSLDRFTCAAERVRKYKGRRPKTAVKWAFKTLKRISQASTQWSIVYDVSKGRIHFRTHSAPKVRWLDLGELSFSCETPVKVLDVTADLSGDVTDRFIDYDRELNWELIAKSYSKTPFLQDVSIAALDSVAAYPDATGCVFGIDEEKVQPSGQHLSPP